LIYGGYPYYCPNGWYRISLKVSDGKEDFENKYGNWPLAYHGTKIDYAGSILNDKELNAAH
jgi:hypothetical protein